MSENTATKTNKNENRIYEDEFEEEFSRINIEDIPLPKEELKDFRYEVNEVMKSGCNLQIAEYSLLKCNIIPELKPLKEDYNNNKKIIKKKMDDDIIVYFYNKSNKNAPQKNYGDEKLNYEEEALEIMEEYKYKIEKNDYLLKDMENIKKDLTNIFEDNVKKSNNKDKFLKAQKNYREKREAIIEAALRLVKKIVNDDNEYKKFHDEYFDKK